MLVAPIDDNGSDSDDGNNDRSDDSDSNNDNRP